MKKILYIVILSQVCFICIGQQIPYDNIYLANKYLLSPAFAGASKNIEASLAVRKNWFGFEGAPEIQVVSIDGAISDKSNTGFGASFVHYRTGNITHFTGNFSYAYHVQLNRNNFLSFGLNGEVYKNQLEIGNLKGQKEDPTLMNNNTIKGTTFNSGFGIAYRMIDKDRALNIGVYSPRLLETKINYNGESQFTTEKHFIVHASYLFSANKYFDVEPFIIGRMTLESELLYESNIRIRFDKRLWIAPGYRKGGLIFNAGAALGTNIVMNYSYEFSKNGILAASSGTHEIALSFLIKRNNNRPRPSIFPDEKRIAVSRSKEKKLKNENEQLKVENEKVKEQIANINKRIDSLMTTKNSPPQPNERTFILKNIRFSKSSDKLFSSSYPALNKLAATLRRNPSIVIKISGHTDDQGSGQYNLRLSKRRAEAIAKYLIERQRISPKRIKTEGLGETKPLIDKKTEQARAKNRRIEILFKKETQK